VAARRPALAALLAAALGLTLAACGGRVGGAATDPTGAVDDRAPSLSPSASLPTSGGFDLPAEPPRPPGFEVGDLPVPDPVPGATSGPARLVIPAIGVATRLLRLGLEPGGAMQVPDDFGRAGWFAKGPAPGQVGPAVIAGHVDSRSGPAVFYRLRELRPGQVVLVERADGTRLRFTVEATRSFPKDRFPTAAVFGPVPTPALRLITCAGDFDRARGSYLDNLVVFAGLVATDRGNRG
jgi:Sortase domain